MKTSLDNVINDHLIRYGTQWVDWSVHVFFGILFMDFYWLDALMQHT